jgi:hypothetical protein
MDMTPYAEPTETELEQIMDEARRDCGQGPAPRTPAEGIADMNARIEYHTKLRGKLAQWLKRMPDGDKSIAAFRQSIAESDRQLAEARDRLREYQLQAQGRN